ncbi:HtaA domain-containing protein [Phytomonospora sp. NPDC050363]|uniref:HtaA domain-containing protein n=1 Tax=Phytomonospora sp. NPDC050363 TaxID=3155642 RepID=UPI0033C7AA7C
MAHTSTRWRRSLAVAAILTATGAAVLAAVAPANAGTTLPITNGETTWGVKETFRKYVVGPIGHGRITVSDGARSYDDGTYGFTGGTGTYDLSTHSLTAAFEGKVTFQAHKSGEVWALDMSISQVRVTTDNPGKTGKVIADVSSKDMATGEVRLYDDVELATLDLTGIAPEQDNLGYTWLRAIPAELTEAGAPAFGGFYAAGSALDPVTVKVKAEAPDPEPSSTSASPSSPAPTGPSGTPTTDPATTDPAGPADVVDGTLDWGVKESFRKYIVGPIAKGEVELSDGATDNGDGYRFGAATGVYDAEKGVLTAAYQGTVHFLGHESGGHYELDLTFTDLNLKVTGDEGTLYVGETALATFTAEVAVDDGVIALNGVPTTLTADGAAFFGGFYEAGAELDPLTTAIALDDDAQLPGPGGTDTTGPGAGGGGPSVSLPLTGASLTGFAAAGAALIAAGGAALFFAAKRRRAAAGTVV